MLDQGLWSLAFFVFNATALGSVSLEAFAAAAVATAIGFVGVSAVRSFSLTAGVVLGVGRGVSSVETVDWRRALGSSVTGALACAAIVVLWMTVAGVNGPWVFGALVLAMVLADAPRQALIVAGLYARALTVSFTYLAGAVVWAFVATGSTALEGWVLALILVAGLGWAVYAASHARLRFVRVAWGSPERKVAVALSLESFYFGLASQAGLLLLFSSEDDLGTAGIRVAYALVFAPAFAVIQGLTPLLHRKLSENLLAVSGLRNVTALLAKWSGFVIAGAAFSSFGAFFWLPYIGSEVQFWSVLPFLLPVGLSLVSGQILEATVVGSRMIPALRGGLHRQRTVLAAFDVASQVLGVILAGATGLIGALFMLSALRIMLATWYWFRIRGSREELAAGLE